MVAYSQQLFQVLKDHNNRSVYSRSMRYFYEAVREVARRRKITLLENPNFVDPLADERPMARLILKENLQTNVREDMVKAMDNIKFTRIELDIINQESNSGEQIPSCSLLIPEFSWVVTACYCLLPLVTLLMGTLRKHIHFFLFHPCSRN